MALIHNIKLDIRKLQKGHGRYLEYIEKWFMFVVCPTVLAD